jgi:hypothetical protein
VPAGMAAGRREEECWWLVSAAGRGGWAGQKCKVVTVGSLSLGLICVCSEQQARGQARTLVPDHKWVPPKVLQINDPTGAYA